MFQYLVLVCSNDDRILQLCDIALSKSAYSKVSTACSFRTCVLSDSEIKPRMILSGMNDLDDYNDGGSDAEFLESEHDSLLTKAILGGGKAVLKADYFGLMPLFLYHDNDTTIVSNNVFLVNFFLDKPFSTDSLFDALLFKKPRFERTWFSDIYRLKPDERLEINLLNNEVSRLGGGHGYSLPEPVEGLDLVEEYKEFFDKSIQVIQNKNQSIELSLSSGSDSRTVLAGLMYKQVPFRAKSWGETYYRETKLISEFVKKFGINWELIGFSDFADNLDKYNREAVLYSSGDAPSTHLYYFYTHHEPGTALFQGYGGSELFKGELSDGMISNIYSDVIVDNRSPKNAILNHFPTLESSITDKMTGYYKINYGDFFVDVNTEAGKRKFQEYLMEFIPGRIFSGAFSTGLACGLNLYEPFFSRRVLRALFSMGGGIATRISIRKDFPGSVQSISFQSKIVKALAPSLYRTPLDRGSSFSSVDKSPPLAKLEKKISSLNHYILSKRGYYSGQVDYSRINSKERKQELNPFIADILKTNDSNNPFLNYVNFYYNTIQSINREMVLNLLNKSK